MFDAASFLRVVAFAVVYAGIEYKYINRYERDWPKTREGLLEKPVLSVFTPYHVYLLAPLFAVAAFTTSFTAWIGNGLVLAVLEDIVYFAWREKRVMKGEWTTTIIGSFSVGTVEIPAWWPIDAVAAFGFFLVPF